MSIAIIPARSGSRRIPNKNLCEIGGKSLVEWAVKCAKLLKYDTIVLTTDYPFSAFPWLAGVPGLCYLNRDVSLAEDNIPLAEVVADVIRGSLATPVALIQPTNPFLWWWLRDRKLRKLIMSADYGFRLGEGALYQLPRNEWLSIDPYKVRELQPLAVVSPSIDINTEEDLRGAIKLWKKLSSLQRQGRLTVVRKR
jgi:hypothetical protein